MSKVEKAVEQFEKGYNCSQAVLSTYCEQLGLDYDTALKIATGFGGGMHIDGTCGAITGAFMALGLKYGNTIAKDQVTKENVYIKIIKFSRRFNDQHGSTQCHELLGCDITKKEGLEIARQKGVFSVTCPNMVKSAAEILEKMFEEKDG
ncbi:MAG: C_GCAxxG_C_C family protein [Sedimentisphaerales bacterium]|nr:C_GCAxxG_C_C family protein [Sedimentisphaerales bacterium]